MDGDGDGRLSRAEYAPFDSGETFDSIDADRDGFMSAEELRAWVLVTEPRPMDRPARSAAMIASGQVAPSFAAQPLAGMAPVAPGGVSAGAAATAPAPAAGSRWLTRVLVLGGMTAVAALIGWRLLQPPTRRRR